MKIGIPKEVKNNEYRVAITPSGVHELTVRGHEVFVENAAGIGSSIPDEYYVSAGAKVLPDADAVWDTAELVLKVKEPVPAPTWTATSWPRTTSSCTPAGVIATRYSLFLTSLGTPMRTGASLRRCGPILLVLRRRAP